MLFVVNLVNSVWGVHWLSSLSMILNFCRANSIKLSFRLKNRYRSSIIFKVKSLYWVGLQLAMLSSALERLCLAVEILILLNNCFARIKLLADASSVMTHCTEGIPCYLSSRRLWVSFIAGLPVSLIVNLVMTVLSYLFFDCGCSELWLMCLLMSSHCSKLFIWAVLLGYRT
jgi:hypothetical protein